MNRRDGISFKDVGSMPLRLLAGSLAMITVVQWVLMFTLVEKISNKELIYSLSLTYLNSLVGFVLYKVAFRGSEFVLLALGLLGNFFRASFFATVIFGVMSIGLKSPPIVLLVTMLCNLAVWMVEIGSLHFRSLNVYVSSHERTDI